LDSLIEIVINISENHITFGMIKCSKMSKYCW